MINTVHICNMYMIYTIYIYVWLYMYYKYIHAFINLSDLSDELNLSDSFRHITFTLSTLSKSLRSKVRWVLVVWKIYSFHSNVFPGFLLQQRKRETESKHKWPKCKLAQRMQWCNSVASEASSSCVRNDFLRTRSLQKFRNKTGPSNPASSFLKFRNVVCNDCNACNIFESKWKHSKSQLHTKNSSKAQAKYVSKCNYRPGWLKSGQL